MIWIIIEFLVFLAAISISVLVILDDPTDLKGFTLLITVMLLGIGIARRSSANENEKKKQEYAIILSGFIVKGNEIRSKINSDPLPIQEHNEWVEEIRNYLNKSGKPHCVARFNDCSDMTFYGDGSERSNLGKSFTGRITRLHEFIKETGV